MWVSKLRAAAFIPTVFTACFGLATVAHAVPPPPLIANQQDGVFITDGTRNYTFQTNLEPGDTECPVSTSPCEAFIPAVVGSSPRLPAGFTAGIVYLTFPGETGLSTIPNAPANASDALLLLPVTAGDLSLIAAFFISDDASATTKTIFGLFATFLPVLGSIQETGQWQDVTGFFVNGGSGLFYIQSDAQSEREVPEPASLAMLGSALLGFAAIRRRKRA